MDDDHTITVNGLEVARGVWNDDDGRYYRCGVFTSAKNLPDKEIKQRCLLLDATTLTGLMEGWEHATIKSIGTKYRAPKEMFYLLDTESELLTST